MPRPLEEAGLGPNNNKKGRSEGDGWRGCCLVLERWWICKCVRQRKEWTVTQHYRRKSAGEIWSSRMMWRSALDREHTAAMEFNCTPPHTHTHSHLPHPDPKHLQCMFSNLLTGHVSNWRQYSQVLLHPELTACPEMEILSIVNSSLHPRNLSLWETPRSSNL